jgi:hypothetical protein
LLDFIYFNVYIYKLELPCKIVKPLIDQNPTEHNNTSFEVVLSKPNHTVKWYLNNVELVENEKFHAKQIEPVRFSLEINDVLMNDEGRVKCVVFNDKGEEVAKSECNLTVTGNMRIFN